MKRFSITLRVLSPLAIRADHAQGGSVTAKYVSGTTLMGSLAGVHRYMYGNETDEFAALFLRDAVLYPNLYPAVFTDKGMQGASFLPVCPLPKTAQSCKRFFGFKYHFEREDDDKMRHGVRDTLIDWALFSFDPDGRGLAALEKHKYCSICEASMYHFSGYYRRNDLAREEITSAQVDTRLQAHTGINRRTGTVQESILYNREVFEEGMEFWGEVKLADDLADSFVDLIEKVGDTGLVRVGTGRTRGSGKVTLGIKAINNENTLDTFNIRLQAFNKQLRSEAEHFELSKLLQPFYFAVTLHSPVILRDDLLRYEGTLSATRLARLAKVPDDTFECGYQAASVRRVTGWNELWGMPKTNEYAIETGSVFLFSCSKAPDEVLLRSLYDLEEQGIGRRQAEGFGRIRISDPFHREVGLL